MGLVLLSVVSSGARSAEHERPAPPPVVLAINPSYQPEGFTYPMGGSQQWLNDETQVVRRALPLTPHIDQPRNAVITHTVQTGDTIFSIARRYSLQPESILWANPGLKNNPDLLSVGMDIAVPPTDGVMHVVQPDDTFDSIAKRGSQNWAGHETQAVGQALPSTTRATGTGGSIDAGRCTEVTPTLTGTGRFIWPTDSHQVSGNPYAWWHRGIDLFGAPGDPVYAADTGVVVWAGPNSWGYGLMVMLDHGNGWQTLYAHLSQVYVHCGQQIPQGAAIGAVGSTGHSTGPHLHFETRHNGDLPDPCLMHVGPEQACLQGTFNAGPSAPIGFWIGRYYDNMFVDGDPTLVRTDLAIDFDWGYDSPGSGMPRALWSARWTRSVDLAAGTYRFHAIVDDGVRVFVDDQVVIDKWEDAAGIEHVGDRALATGNHTIKVEYYQKGHEARIKLWWEKLH